MSIGGKEYTKYVAYLKILNKKAQKIKEKEIPKQGRQPLNFITIKDPDNK